MKKLLIAFALTSALFSCKKEKSKPVVDSTANTTQYGMTVFKDQSSTVSHNALVAQYVGQNLDYVINMYGSFNPDKTPENINTITYQKVNNDTLHYFLIDTITNKMQTAFYEVKGIKSPVVIKFDYLKSLTNDVRVSFFSYNWQNQTSDLLTSTVCKDDSSSNVDGSGLKKRGGFSNLLQAVAAVMATDVIFVGLGGTTGVILSASAAAALYPVIGTMFVATAIGVAIMSGTANASELLPSDKVYPKNTSTLNPITVSNNPLPNLVTTPVDDKTAKDFEINFSATMDKNGTISITGVQGGIAPYTYYVGPSTQSTPIFANNYASGEYLIAVKDATKLVKSKKIKLTRNDDSNTNNGYNVKDIDGNSYKTVTIGVQTWMAENLKTSRYSDGTTIPNITDNTQWQNNTTGAWAYYNNDAANNAKYGKLYNWYAVSKTTNGNKNVCPTGWHVPTDAEWTVLTDYLGDEFVAGGKMKEVGTTSWNSPNTGATNTSLFTGLPGGYRFYDGNYYFIGDFGYWWSSSENDTYSAWYRGLSSYSGHALRNASSNKGYGFSVRCLRD